MTTHLALVGGAHIHTPGFIDRLNKRTDVAVKYVWDHDPARSQKRAEALQAQSTPELDIIWNDASIKGVIVCSETNRHGPLVLAAAAAGKHLFVEKPLGMGAADAYPMADAIQKAGVLFQTGYFMRGSPALRFLKSQIEAGKFGLITRYRHTNCHSGSLGGWFDTEWRWMADRSQAGCGAFGDLGTHALDIMLWLMGPVRSVTASLDTATHRYGEIDEFGEGLLKFENGCIGSLAAGWVDVTHPVSLVLSGTEGHAYIANGQLFIQSAAIPGADGKLPWIDLPPAWPHAFELFLDAVIGIDHDPLVTAHEAAYRSAVMEALYSAAEQQAWVKPILTAAAAR
jgi:predicted dehydrogenase